MSSLDDYKREQELLFQELEERQRRSQRLVTEEEFAHDIERAGIQVERLGTLARQMQKLARLSGMSEDAAKEWAFSTIWAGVRKRIEKREQEQPE